MKIQNNTNSATEMMKQAISKAEKNLSVCDKKIECLTHPELYGCCLTKCNSIVINKERMMTVTYDKYNYTTYEFCPLYPTYFSPNTAASIVEFDVFKDSNGDRIKLEIIGELEYYRLLKEYIENGLQGMRMVLETIN